MSASVISFARSQAIPTQVGRYTLPCEAVHSFRSVPVPKTDSWHVPASEFAQAKGRVRPCRGMRCVCPSLAVSDLPQLRRSGSAAPQARFLLQTLRRSARNSCETRRRKALSQTHLFVERARDAVFASGRPHDRPPALFACTRRGGAEPGERSSRIQRVRAGCNVGEPHKETGAALRSTHIVPIYFAFLYLSFLPQLQLFSYVPLSAGLIFPLCCNRSLLRYHCDSSLTHLVRHGRSAHV